MSLLPTYVPKIVPWMFPRRLWAVEHNSNTVYLTFDDGPIPEVTPWVLKTLKDYDAKATFFCIGENIQKHPTIYTEILKQGHSIGNHTQHHVNGWKTKNETFFKDVLSCQKTIENYSSKVSHQNTAIKKLFRPPFGKVTSSQAKWLLSKGYRIIMWSLLSKDFEIQTDKEKNLSHLLKYLKAGSVVVFHDSKKAEEKLRYMLPKVLAHCKKKNWECKVIPL